MAGGESRAELMYGEGARGRHQRGLLYGGNAKEGRKVTRKRKRTRRKEQSTLVVSGARPWHG